MKSRPSIKQQCVNGGQVHEPAVHEHPPLTHMNSADMNADNDSDGEVELSSTRTSSSCMNEVMEMNANPTILEGVPTSRRNLQR